MAALRKTRGSLFCFQIINGLILTRASAGLLCTAWETAVANVVIRYVKSQD